MLSALYITGADNVRQESGQLTASPSHTLYSPDRDLADYTATSTTVTAGWTTSDGDTLVRRAVVGGAPAGEGVALDDGENRPGC